MNNNDRINFEYSLRPNGMDSTLFWELNQIVASQIQKPFVEKIIAKKGDKLVPVGRATLAEVVFEAGRKLKGLRPLNPDLEVNLELPSGRLTWREKC